MDARQDKLRTRGNSWLHLLLLCLAQLVLLSQVQAHEVRPAYLEIKPLNEGWQVSWRQPILGDLAVRLRPSQSSGWLEQPPANISRTPTHLIREWVVNAPDEPLEGQQLTIEGLERTITDTLVKVHFADGTEITRLLKADSPQLTLSSNESITPAVAAYFVLGIEHILFGIDHLLFVLGLLLLVRSKAMLCWTITGFTVAHSITLGLASLEIIRVSVELVEALIALSILFVAVEVVNLWRGQPGWSSRWPWAIASAFGLLHGLGFASALGEVGLPGDAVVPALLLFNIGVEVGQLLFVALMLLLAGLLRRQHALPVEQTRWVTPYAIGAMAGFWFLDRSLMVLLV
jgi:hydrogenase/urease accessory protein HupE